MVPCQDLDIVQYMNAYMIMRFHYRCRRFRDVETGGGGRLNPSGYSSSINEILILTFPIEYLARVHLSMSPVSVHNCRWTNKAIRYMFLNILGLNQGIYQK